MTIATEAVESNIVREVIDRGKVTGAQIMVIVTSLVLNMIDGFDVTAMAFTVHSIGEQLQITPDHLGIVFSVALAGMMLGAMFVAPFSDVLGRRKMILICVSAIGISMFLTGSATSLWELIIYRSITGLGVGGMLASLAAVTAEYTPEKYRSFSVVTITAGYPLGATLGGFIAAPLIPVYGWEFIFYGGGLLTLAMVVGVYLFVPESLQFLIARRPAGALEKFNRILKRLRRPPLAELPVRSQEAEREKANVMSLLTPERRRLTLTLWATFFFCFICLYFLMSWVPKLVVNAGLTESQGIYASVAFNGGGVAGIIALGWLSAKMGLSRLITAFLIASAIGMIVFAVANGVSYLLSSLVVIGFLLQGGFTGLYAVAARVYPTELRTTGVGWAIGLGRFGAVVGPYVGGLMIARGLSMEFNFIAFAIPLFMGGLMAYQLKVR